MNRPFAPLAALMCLLLGIVAFHSEHVSRDTQLICGTLFLATAMLIAGFRADKP